MLTQQSNDDRHYMLVEKQGVLPSDTSTMQDAEPWKVQTGAFAFRVQFRAAATSTVLLESDTSGPHQLQAKPMKVNGSELTFRVMSRITADGRDVPLPFVEQPMMKEVPSALYGECMRHPCVDANATFLTISPCRRLGRARPRCRPQQCGTST